MGGCLPLQASVSHLQSGATSAHLHRHGAAEVMLARPGLAGGVVGNLPSQRSFPLVDAFNKPVMERMKGSLTVRCNHWGPLRVL